MKEEGSIRELDKSLVDSIRNQFSPEDFIAAEEQFKKVTGR
jgi:hypothetical protein